MANESATATPLKTRFKDRVFLFSKVTYPSSQAITKLINLCGGTVVEDADSGVTDVVSNSAGTQATQKLVAQLSKKNGTQVRLTESMDVPKLLAVTLDDLIPLLAAGEAELWNSLSGELGKKIKLSDVKLNAMDLSRFVLDACDLKGADMSGCTMRHWRFRDVAGANLDSANFTKTELIQSRSCTFKNAVFSECTLTDSMSDCDFRSANLSGTIASSAKFSNCDFSDCNLAEAQLDGTIFKNCKFSKTDLSKANLMTANLTNANLSEASLKGAMAYESKLDNATLVGVDFRNSFFCGASFKGADLAGADFTGAATSGANFKGANLTNVVGLSTDKAAKSPKSMVNLKKFEEIAIKIQNFHVGIEVDVNGVRVKFHVRAFKKQGYIFGTIVVSDYGSAPPAEYKSISEAMIGMAQQFPEGVLDIDSLYVVEPKKCKEDFKALSIAAWCEALGTEVLSVEELDARKDEKAAILQSMVQELLSELKGGPNGIEKWNARRQRDEQIVSLQGQDFSKTDLGGAVLNGVDLRDCNFNGANLVGTSMQNVDCPGASFVAANAEKVNFASANLYEADFSNAKLTGAQLPFSWLERANFSGADLTNCKLSCARIEGTDFSSAILNQTNFNEADFDQDTKFPPEFKPLGTLNWQGKGVNPFLVAEAKRQASGDLDFDGFVQALQKDFDKQRMKKVVKMLQADRFQLFADVTDQAITGIVKSQTDPDLLYSCRLGSDGSFACCTQNTNSCGGLRGALCKHILVLIVALANSEKVSCSKALESVLLSKAHQPKLDKSLMAETFLRYKGSEAGEIDWRPMETVPEDYYAF